MHAKRAPPTNTRRRRRALRKCTSGAILPWSRPSFGLRECRMESRWSTDSGSATCTSGPRQGGVTRLARPRCPFRPSQRCDPAPALPTASPDRITSTYSFKHPSLILAYWIQSRQYHAVRRDSSLICLHQETRRESDLDMSRKTLANVSQTSRPPPLAGGGRMSNETIPGAKIDIHPSTSLKRNAFEKRSISSRIVFEAKRLCKTIYQFSDRRFVFRFGFFGHHGFLRTEDCVGGVSTRRRRCFIGTANRATFLS